MNSPAPTRCSASNTRARASTMRRQSRSTMRRRSRRTIRAGSTRRASSRACRSRTRRRSGYFEQGVRDRSGISADPHRARQLAHRAGRSRRRAQAAGRFHGRAIRKDAVAFAMLGDIALRQKRYADAVEADQSRARARSEGDQAVWAARRCVHRRGQREGRGGRARESRQRACRRSAIRSGSASCRRR